MYLFIDSVCTGNALWGGSNDANKAIHYSIQQPKTVNLCKLYLCIVTGKLF